MKGLRSCFRVVESREYGGGGEEGSGESRIIYGCVGYRGVWLF